MSRYVPVLVKRYWTVVMQLGCAVTGDTNPANLTLHHCHGGSMVERGFGRSMGRKTSWWLVICLRRDLHVGPGGIDGFPRPSVEEWEAKHGRQADMVDALVARTGIDVWQLAREEEKGMVPRSAG